MATDAINANATCEDKSTTRVVPSSQAIFEYFRKYPWLRDQSDDVLSRVRSGEITQEKLAEKHVGYLAWLNDKEIQEKRRREGQLHFFLGYVGKRYANATLDNFQVSCDAQAKAVATLRKFIEDYPEHREAGTGLLFVGGAGTGKDHLAVACAREAILQHGANFGWCEGASLFRRVRASFDERHGECEVEIIRDIASHDVWLISDPVPPVTGHERSQGSVTEFQAGTLLQVIDERYRAMKPTWATLNVASGEEMNSRLSSPVADRLRHGATLIVCDWATHRTVAKPVHGGTES